MTDKRRYDPIRRIEQFWQKVNKDGPIAVVNGIESRCWVYLGTPGLDRKRNPDTNTGYGRFFVNRKPILVHRFAWTLIRGEIGTNLTLDHLCRNTMCVNPEHL